MIRVGIMGGSGIAAMHAEAVRSHPEVAEIVAVAEIDPTRRAAFVEHWLHAPVAIAAARARVSTSSLKSRWRLAARSATRSSPRRRSRT